MADNLNEQELQALFRKHLPMKQMPPEFADQLKKQVLAEVAATLGAKPVASVVTEETAATPILRSPERAMQRRAPRSVRVQSTMSWLDWFREYFRLTPSMAMAGAMLLALFAIIVWSSDVIPGLPGPFATTTPGTVSVVQVTQSPPAEATATAVAVAEVVVSPSSTAPGETATPEPTPSATAAGEITQTVVVTANPLDDPVTPAASMESGSTILTPTDTATPRDDTPAMPTTTANVDVQATLTPAPSATPTRVLRLTVTATPADTDTVTPESITHSTVMPTSVTPAATGVGTTTAPTAEPIKRPFMTPTATSLPLPVATATKPQTSGPVLSTTITPFVPTATPSPTTVSTLVLVPTATPTVAIVPWRSPTPTLTDTPSPTPTDLLPTATSVLPAVTMTVAPINTDEPVLVPTDTDTPLPTPTNTRRPTATATVIVVPPTNTRLPTVTPAPTDTPSPTATLSLPTATPTNTPLPTATPTDTPLPTATPTDTPLPTATPTNVPPSINGEPVTSAAVDTDYLYTMTANDSDGSLADLRFDVLEKPAWLQSEFLGNGYLKLYGRPSAADVGEHKVKIQVHDGAGGIGTIEFVIVVASSTAAGPFADSTQDIVSATNGSGETVILGASITETLAIPNPGN